MRISIRQITSFASRRVKFRFFSGELDETANVEGREWLDVGFEKQGLRERESDRVNFDEFNIIFYNFVFNFFFVYNFVCFNAVNFFQVGNNI